MDETSAPPLAGPSEFALGITVHATPDSILQDGASQSVISIDAKGPDGQPARSVSMRLEISVGGTVQDFGTLSTKTTTTDGNGTARVTYTAPPKPAESVGSGTLVTILVTPLGNDYRAEMGRQVDIRVIPPGVIVPPDSLVPAFTVTPDAPTAFTQTTFDASTTTNEGVACGTRCSYAWSFGDGGTGTGMVAQHEFRSVGTFVVQLTVSGAQGRMKSTTKTVTVGGGTAPTASFTFSPTAPLPGQAIFFSATASTAPAGRRIVTYEWDFGSGRTGDGVSVSKTYDTAGVYVVTLKVTDDANQFATTTQTVTVGGGSATLPTASFVYSPSNPSPGEQIFFNATASTAGPGRQIVSYLWDFGSGRTGTGMTISKGYDTAGSYAVTLTVTDDTGAIATRTQTVSVGGGSVTPPTAAFVFSPEEPATGQTVFFNASGSRPGPGRQIVSYQWDFGNGFLGATSGPTASWTFPREDAYVVTLRVVDDHGVAGTISRTIRVVGATGAVNAAFTFSPDLPLGGQTVTFDANDSVATPGATITTYTWDFNDGVIQSSVAKTIGHVFTATGTYRVVLTVRDSLGNVGVTTRVVSVQ